jgi:phosphoribosyl-AMP cyclohydrolase
VPQSNIDKNLAESGPDFLPKFNANGLVTAVVSEAITGSPLMVAHMNRKALELSLSTGEAHFFSRSRGEIWHKGGTSGNVLSIDDILIDCDQDAVWLRVTPQGHGAACHTGQKSCFYRRVVLDGKAIVLEKTDALPLFDPAEVYKT